MGAFCIWLCFDYVQVTIQKSNAEVSPRHVEIGYVPDQVTKKVSLVVIVSQSVFSRGDTELTPGMKKMIWAETQCTVKYVEVSQKFRRVLPYIPRLSCLRHMVTTHGPHETRVININPRNPKVR